MFLFLLPIHLLTQNSYFYTGVEKVFTLKIFKWIPIIFITVSKAWKKSGNYILLFIVKKTRKENKILVVLALSYWIRNIARTACG